MTGETDRLPGQRDRAGGAVRGVAATPREGGRAPTTTVPVIPLWERLRTGAHG